MRKSAGHFDATSRTILKGGSRGKGDTHTDDAALAPLRMLRCSVWARSVVFLVAVLGATVSLLASEDPVAEALSAFDELLDEHRANEVSKPAVVKPSNRLQIKVDHTWPLEDTSRVESVLYETANAIYKHFGDSRKIEVTVGYRSAGSPIALYYAPHEVPNRVLLTPSPIEHRSQIIYQFAHEFCHVVTDYNRFNGFESANAWFAESLCELASIFALHQTGDDNLKRYVDNYLSDSLQALQEISDFKRWLLAREPQLRADSALDVLDRTTNAVVAYKLLPWFQQYPETWGTLKRLPVSDSSLSVLLDEWQSVVRYEHKHLIQGIRDTLLKYGPRRGSFLIGVDNVQRHANARESRLL